MKNMKIVIKSINNDKGRYIAYHKEDFLDAAFWVCFNDSITGAIALNHFAQMIRSRFNINRTDFVIEGGKMQFKNPALLDEILGKNGGIA